MAIGELSRNELVEVFDLKYRGGGALGPGPARRLRFDYFSPDEHYEALVRRLVQPATRWLDVGCGRDIFPSNRPLARELSQRCSLLVGVDPDATIHENEFVHRKFQGMVADLPRDLRFDLVTLRMVAEHVADPHDLLRSLAGIVVPGGKVLIYTVNRWSPVSLITNLVPFRLHNPVKRVLWNTEAKDTFPTEFKMNTRRELTRLFASHDFDESAFWHLDDCRALSGFSALETMELTARTLIHRVGLRYPENCLLGVYERRAKPPS
jgi:SAM-dependent methyltransferase